jgi:hypothetical protein
MIAQQDLLNARPGVKIRVFDGVRERLHDFAFVDYDLEKSMTRVTAKDGSTCYLQSLNLDRRIAPGTVLRVHRGDKVEVLYVRSAELETSEVVA